MSEVIRYDYLYNEDGELQLEELPIGRFVYHSDYAALLARHNALVEAVKRMMAADSPGVWNAKDYMEARAEVDRLIASQGSADCQGEG